MKHTTIASWLLASALVLATTACSDGPGDSKAPGAAAKNVADAGTEPMTINQTEESPMVKVDSSYALVGTQWWVEDILAGGVIDRSRTTIAFLEEGRVAGNGGCNRYMGSFELDGEALSFGQLAGTMMACPEALMNQDRRFHEAMAQVTAWEISQSGLLHLKNEAGETVIRASELREGEAA